MSNSTDRWEFYRDGRSKWRWRRVAANGRIVDASTQGYGTRSTCIVNATRCGYEPPTKQTQKNTRLTLMGHGLEPECFGNPSDTSESNDLDA